MRQEDGLIPKLIEKMEINKEHFINNGKIIWHAKSKSFRRDRFMSASI